MAGDCDAIVVGSGPNGLAAAITLARAGLSVRVLEANSTIGGGARSTELTLPGFVHDLCSAIHPLAAGSPFFQTLPLERFGLTWIHPDIPLAHPLDHGRAVCLHRDLGVTARSLGQDEHRYQRLMEPFVRNWQNLSREFLQPILHIPRHPLALARFGLLALWPANILANTLFREERTRALFAGTAAHSFLPLDALVSAAFALVLGSAGHAVGWPFPRGGSQAISNALADYFRELGGKIDVGHRIDHLSALPKARAAFFDVSAWQFARIAGEQLPERYRRRLQNFRHAPAVFKIDYALSSPIPWLAQDCCRAGTVHLGGTLNEIKIAEQQAVEGKIPDRPFTLVAQQSVFDQARSPEGKHTLWAYCHVPFGCTADMAGRIESQIERFAPGFRNCILARHKSGPGELENSNFNLVGGDISGGAADLMQLIARPILSPTPYRTPLRGIYLCSSSTPPGGGVHGMCGHQAARVALRDIFGINASAT